MLILHIGRHKCGSTSIQYFLSRNAERLAELGVSYPKVGRVLHAHHGLSSALVADREEELLEVLGLERADPERKFVLSSEGLELLKPRQINALKARVGDTRVRIVVYVRDLSGLVPSRYSERTKKGANTLDFDRFFDKHGQFRRLDNSLRVELWARAFGWENLRIRSLDSRSLTGGNLIADFLSILGLELSALGGRQARGLEPQNVSNGWKVLEVLRAQYTHFAPYEEHQFKKKNRSVLSRDVHWGMRTLMVHIMTELGLDAERTQYLSARQWQRCDDVYTQDIENLNKYIVGPPLPQPEQRMNQDRPFLPSIELIPIEERRAIAARLESVLVDDKRTWSAMLAQWLEEQLPSVSLKLFGPARPSRSVAKLQSAGLSAELRRSLVDTLVAAPFADRS